MASGQQNQEEGVPENLRKQLAVAVRSIQWSYAIFWSISSRQPGVLEWGDGYYNGDIKTRKTVQAVEFNADQLGLLQRSEQLRELYESLAAGESSPQARRPSAALSPEDLTDTEWYYLVCMSFVFNVGQGLAGRTLANGQPIWLCNAHHADSKVFTRSLLAKSASIQTVVCFPFLGGVIELGATELVLEDPGLIQHIKTSFLEIPYPMVSQKTNTHTGNARNDVGFSTNFNDIVGCEYIEVCSPNNSSNMFGINQPAEESFLVGGLNEDDEISNCAHNSMSSSDCISQTLVNPEKGRPAPKAEKGNDGFTREIQEHNQMKMTSMGLQADDDVHYQSVISTLLKCSHQLILGPNFRNRCQQSSFLSWKKGDFVGTRIPQSSTPQRLLKKVLFEVTKRHGGRLSEHSREDDGRRDLVWKPEVDDIDSNHVLAERKRREKLSKRFSVLGSLVPSTSKVDKVSILDNTIDYLKELERRVQELDSCRAVKPQDTTERTSENYGNYRTGTSKKPMINKRKAQEIDEVIEPEKDSASTDNVNVSVIHKEVLIEIRCPWRECLLLELIDAISNLHLDSHSVQSTNTDGILSLTIKSKFKGSTFASAGTIRKALQRVIQKG